MAGGRPTDYTEEIAAKIIERIMSGDSVRYIVADDDMPARRTIYNWLANNKEFLHQYTQAREVQAEHIFDEMFDIADNGANDFYGKGDNPDEPDYYEFRGEHVQRARLRIETRKWALSRMAPKKYGESVRHKHGGDEDAPPISTVDMSKLNPEQLKAIATIKLPADGG